MAARLLAVLVLVWLAHAVPAAAAEALAAGIAGLDIPHSGRKVPAASQEPADCAGQALSTRQDYRALAACHAAKYGLPAAVAHAVIEIESGYDPEARGSDGEVGLMQMLPSTARLMGFRGTPDDLSQPGMNIPLGVRYLAKAWSLASGDLCTAVMKYRAGHAETRFSVLSVRYCDRARQILRREGVAVTGKLPEATFGFEAGSPTWTGGTRTATGGARKKGVCVRRHFVAGPSYMKCAEVRSSADARRITALRARLFD